MQNKDITRAARGVRFGWLFMLVIALLAGAAIWGNSRVEANHPVLVEGNCDSPVPGTTLVIPEGTCGDFDGDGRVGTAEDTDGADRIFGTLKAALGPGTGAAAGTGANQNGTIMIVASGRFAEQLVIGRDAPSFPGFGGTANPGNVTIEAAPGVFADIDAVLQGDPAGGNTARQNSFGILIHYPGDVAERTVTLRNLTIRNFSRGVWVSAFNNVLIENCVIQITWKLEVCRERPRIVIRNSTFEGNGRRIGGPSAIPSPGAGLITTLNVQVRIMDSLFANNAGPGISQSGASTITLYKVGTFFNNPNTVGAVTVAPTTNTAQ